MEDSIKNDIESMKKDIEKILQMLANLDAYKAANEPAYKRFISTAK